MRNNKKSKEVMNLIEGLPVFNLSNLKILDLSENYLRIFLSRKVRSGEIIRLKKGVYTSMKFIEKTKRENRYPEFLEFLACNIYSPSYLSLEYILHQNNLLTDAPVNFTLISKNKTTIFSNKLGNFIYHKIKDELFSGFRAIENDNFIIYKATKAKALFDFLYLRKNLLNTKDEISELRINSNELTTKDRNELEKYIKKEGTTSLKNIYSKIL